MDDSVKSSSSFQNLNATVNETNKDNTPCRKHAANNLTDKLMDPSSLPLCKNCSKAMIPYISLIQEALDNLAKAIYCGEDSSYERCLRQECIVNSTKTEENKTETIVNNVEVIQNEVTPEVVQKSETKVEANSACGDQTTKPLRKPSSRRNSRQLSREIRGIEKETSRRTSAVSYGNQQDWKVNFLYNISPSTSSGCFKKEETPETIENKKKSITILNQEYSYEKHLNNLIKCNAYQDKIILNNASAENCFSAVANETSQTSVNDENRITRRKEQSNEMLNISFIEDYKPDTLSAFEQFVSKEDFMENSDEGALTFSNDDNLTEEAFFQPKIEDNVRKENTIDTPKQNLSTDVKTISSRVENKPWKEDPMETPKQNVSMGVQSILPAIEDKYPAEAFVTICRNNSEALGCLVVGSSLVLSRTSKALCVLVFDGVHTKLKELLSSVFHVVQDIAFLKTLNEVMETQRPLGKSLDKLDIWRIVQFKKCVFLNPDTLVLRNCDELFKHNELSAVPDNGWPDCFNSGVFVFVPSLTTFSQMEEMVKKQEHNDGGDQMFLNSFFNSWSRDLSQKLSFMYNLNLLEANTYTYAAAFQKFGPNVKIVQFSGSSKPWHVRFSNENNQIVDPQNIHSTSIRFLHEWISIFKVSVLRLFPQNIYSHAFAQNTITAEEISKLLCIPVKDEGINRRPFTNHSQGNEKIDSENYEGMKVWEDGKMVWEDGKMDYRGAHSSESIIKRLQLLMQ